ncbi:MAG: uL15m family ribosomal protein [Patescibacteria group bacterium]
MQINTLKIKYFKKKRKTIGRGGKKGTYSGKGGKGQKGRSGVSINPLFEGGRSSLIDRLKKVRGFKSDKPKAVVFKFSDLEKKFKENDIINKESLAKTGLLDKKDIKRRVKILGGGDIKSKFKIGEGITLSASAKRSMGISADKAGAKARPARLGKK